MEVTEQGVGKLGFQGTLRAWPARPGPSPLAGLQGNSPQLLFQDPTLLESFQTDTHPVPDSCTVTLCILLWKLLGPALGAALPADRG